MLYKFTLQHGNIMLTEVVEIPEEIKRIPGRQSQAKGILMFSAENLPALGAKIYKVQRDPSNVQYPRASEKRIQMRFDYDENSFVINRVGTGYFFLGSILMRPHFGTDTSEVCLSHTSLGILWKFLPI